MKNINFKISWILLFLFRILFKMYYSLVCFGCEWIVIVFKLNFIIVKDDDEEENDGIISNENFFFFVIVKRYDNFYF